MILIKVRDDVIRADTRVEHDNLPEQGVTKNIRSHFKSLEQENQATIQHRPSKVASKVKPMVNRCMCCL